MALSLCFAWEGITMSVIACQSQTCVSWTRIWTKASSCAVKKVFSKLKITSGSVEKRLKNPKTSQTFSKTSKRFQLLPNASQWVRMDPKASKSSRKPPKTCENSEKLCKNFEKLRENFTKTFFTAQYVSKLASFKLSYLSCLHRVPN